MYVPTYKYRPTYEYYCVATYYRAYCTRTVLDIYIDIHAVLYVVYEYEYGEVQGTAACVARGPASLACPFDRQV